jgi:amidase
MRTTAGSLALLDARPLRDAFVAHRLRDAGAILLGKANMSEWANFRGQHSISGWSARGGQARNPYVLDRSPCGSSSGSASAVAANLVPGSLGTETDGSILCPGAMCGVVGIKPTVGLTSRAGVIPIAHSQDTVGPFARTVADAALVLDAIAGTDPRDPATAMADTNRPTTYTLELDPAGAAGARLGVSRRTYFGYSPKADRIIEQALEVLRQLGAEVVDPANIPTSSQMARSSSELTVLYFELKADLNAYLSGLGKDAPLHSLAEIITFNEERADRELVHFGQELFITAQSKGSLADRRYLKALEKNRRIARQEGIDAILDGQKLDALVMPTTGPAFKIDRMNGDSHGGSSSQPAALAGYPAITVPAGFAGELPIGITFMGRAFSESTLIRLAYAFEQATNARRQPKFLETIDRDSPQVVS